MRISSAIKRSFLFASLFVFLGAQILPCLAQMQVPVTPHMHTFTLPVMPGHQHYGQTSGANNTFSNHTSNNATHASSTLQHHFFHHWHKVSNDNTNVSTANNGSQSNSLGHDQFVHHGAQLWTNLALNDKPTQSINLDLSSTSANMTAGHIPNNQSIYINVGGNQLSVSSTTKLTAAEFLAVKQVEFSGQQTLVLNSQGSASGGDVVIGLSLSRLISNLLIPQGVTVIDLTKAGTLNINGNITDNGSLYIDSKNPLLSNVNVGANNISVGGNGVFSDVLPSSLLGALPSLNNLPVNADLNLNINAVNNINNAGTISSAGSVGLMAGGTITNSGLVNSANGNINIASTVPANDININGSGGTFQALNGNIDVRDASYTGAGNININGGNYLSQNVNLYSGTGAITGTVSEMTGTLNSYAGSEHFIANTENLILGNNNINGDPTYANNGNITISGALTPSEAIAIIAGGSITANSTGSITTSNAAVTLVAGADITSGGGGAQTITNSTAGVSSSVSFQFNNVHGGNIDFTSGSAGTVIQTGGGSVTLLANYDISGTGNIWFSTSGTSISAVNASDAAGNVLIVAGGSGGTSSGGGTITAAIQTGQILTGGEFSSGTVTMYTAAPVITGTTATYDTHGNMTSGSYPLTSSSYTFNNSGQISINGSVITAGDGGSGGGAGGINAATITIEAGNNASVTNLLAWGAGGGGGDPGDTAGAGGNGANISVTSLTGNITASGEINSSGGGGGGAYSGSGGTGGTAGTITMSATNGNVSVSGSILASNGGNGGNGNNGAGGGGGSFGGGGGGAGGFSGSGGGGGNGAASGGGGAGDGPDMNNSGGGGGGYFGAGAGGDAGGNPGSTNGNSGSLTSNYAYNPSNGVYGAAGGAGNNGSAGGTGSSSFVAGGGAAGGTGGSSGNSAGAGLAGNTISATMDTATTFNGVLVGNTITLTNNAAPGTATTEITTAQLITATAALTIQAIGSGGGLAINSSVKGSTVALTATGAGNIAGTGTIAGTTSETFNGGTGAIGSLNIATPSITTNQSTSGAGSITLVDSVALTSNGISTAGTGGFSLTDSANGGIITTSTITSGGTLSLTNTGTNSSISLGAAIQGTILNITATGTGNITSSSTIVGSSISLTTPSGNIGGNSGATTPILVNNNGSGLSLNASGNIVNLSDTKTEAVTLISTTGTLAATTSFTLRTVGNIIGAASISGTNGSTFTLSSYTGASSQTFTGTSFSNPGGGTVNVVINGLTWVYTYSSSIANGGSIVFVTGPQSLTFINNTGGAISSVSSLVNALNANFQNGSALYPTPTVQSPIISLTSTAGSIGGSSTPINVSNGGTGITTLYASATTGSAYFTDTAHEIVILSTSLTLGNSIVGSAFSLNTYGSIYSTATQQMNEYLAIQAATITLSSSNGNIAQDGTDLFDALQVTNNGGGITLVANAPSGSVCIIDAVAENIVLGTADSGGTSTASTNFTVEGANNISTVDSQLAVRAQNIFFLANNSIGTSSIPILISNGGSGIANLFAFASSGNVYLVDSAHENVTLATVNGGENSQAGAIFSLSTYGSIYANDTSLAIQAPTILLTSSNGSIAADSSNDPLSISNGGSNITSLYASAPTGSVYLNDAASESVYLSTTGTNGISNAGSTFSLNANGSIFSNSEATSIESPTISLAAVGLIENGGGISRSLIINSGGTSGLNVSATTTGSTGFINLYDANAETVTTGTSSASVYYELFAAGSIVVANNISVIGTTATPGIYLLSNGAITVNNGVTISSMSSTNNGGLIEFTSLTAGAGAVTVINNGTVTATNANNSSIVGINGGANSITVTGSGSMSGSQVNFGNLDSSTLQIQSPYVTVSPFTGTYTLGNISVTQNSITGTMQVSGAVPVTPSGSTTTTTISTGLTPQQILFYELRYLALQQSLQQNANTKLYEQIGTRIATDYTPWSTYPGQLPQNPLQGGISSNRLIQAGEALFAASEFNANELNALSRTGVVFGQNSKDNFLDLVKGFVLFMPQSNINVQTREGVVQIPKGAHVWVMETGADAAIYDLHDNIHTGPIKVVVNNKELTMAPGTEILLTRDSTANFESLNPGNALGYRNIRSSNLGSGIKMFVCDFSIPHGLTNIPVINSLLKSNNPTQRQAARMMLKNAAILADLTGDGYKTGP